MIAPRPLLVALLPALATAPLAQAGQAPPSPPARGAQACTTIVADAARLACYDRALKPTTDDTRAADLAAAQAKAELDAAGGDGGQPGRPSIGKLLGRQHFASGANDDNGEATIANAGRGSLLDSRWELAKDSKLGTFQLLAYKPIYLLPGFWTSNKNQRPSSPNPDNTVTAAQTLDSTELKFQLSFKTKLAQNLFGDNGDVWLGYTQTSHWQSYNADRSRPFRETNYEPEAMLVFRSNYSLLGWHGRMTGISINHQSNGRANPLSRSWNRVILNFGLDRENWALMLRPWFRIKEEATDDNNPDIEDYVGRGDATLVWSRNGHELALTARHSLRGGERSHGSAQLDWGFPINNMLRGHIQVFDGYGESLIDYNHKATYIGIGVSLLEWY